MDNGKLSRRWRAVIGWNVLLLSVGAALVFIDWEAWFHLRAPFTERLLPTRFEPGVGLLNEPGAEVRWTNRVDFWVVQRANRWGFLDREPLPPEQAAQTCHIAFIGDSFVEAREVPVADKFHVRLEEIVARDLPRLNISTSAYGRRATGQINQLPFYDEYARQLRPKLVVLVFFYNDFRDNHKLLTGIFKGWDPERSPYIVADKTAAGAIALRPPDPAWRMLPLPASAAGLKSTQLARLRAELLAQRPRYQSDIETALSIGLESLSADGIALRKLLQEPTLPPLFEEAVEFTAFALEEFQRRVAADGASLWLFLTFGVRGAADPVRVVMEDLAEARGIPVVSQHDYIIRQGRRVREGVFSSDAHWNLTGHQWAAEALLEVLRQGPEVCGVGGA